MTQLEIFQFLIARNASSKKSMFWRNNQYPKSLELSQNFKAGKTGWEKLNFLKAGLVQELTWKNSKLQIR